MSTSSSTPATQLPKFFKASKVPCRLVGIAGHAGSGKDTIAEYLCEWEGVYHKAFADPLRSACVELFGIEDVVFENRHAKETVDPYWEVTPRQMAQFVGTELVRQHLDKLIPGVSTDFWIYRLARELQDWGTDETCVISDVRFQNEYDWIVGNEGVVIIVTRPGCDGKVGIPGHASEQGFKVTFPERTLYVENNGSIPQLCAKIRELSLPVYST